MTLTDRAMLVTLNVRQWSAKRTDRKVTHEVAVKYNSDETMGRYDKRLIADSALSELKKITGAARTEHYFRTLPWTDEGFRILSSAGYFEYSAKMAEFRMEFERALATFLAGYPQFVLDAKCRLNGLFNAADYPKNVASRFSFGFDVRPLPDASDFRVQLGDIETARVKAELQASLDASIQTAMSDVWARMRDVVAHMSDRLKAYDATGDKVVNPFRDSVVTNITELLDIVPSLNVTGDSNITQFADAIRTTLATHTPDTLRDAPILRSQVAAEADAILAKMEAFL